MMPKPELDPFFFIISVDKAKKVIVAEYYNQAPMYVFRGTSASKLYSDILDMCKSLSESHREYLKSELASAEDCLSNGKRYIQG